MMKVKFANGAVKECTAPTEQKVFKTVSGATVSAGWVLILRLTGNITSTELDEVVNEEGVSSLEFLTENENGDQATLFSLSGYSKITSSTIRHSEDTECGIIYLTKKQMTK